MEDFSEKIRRMFEMAWRYEGYGDVKTLVVDRNADCRCDSRMKECVEQGYRFVDENMFGDGGGALGKVVVFVRGNKEV